MLAAVEEGRDDVEKQRSESQSQSSSSDCCCWRKLCNSRECQMPWFSIYCPDWSSLSWHKVEKLSHTNLETCETRTFEHDVVENVRAFIKLKWDIKRLFKTILSGEGLQINNFIWVWKYLRLASPHSQLKEVCSTVLFHVVSTVCCWRWAETLSQDDGNCQLGTSGEPLPENCLSLCFVTTLHHSSLDMSNINIIHSKHPQLSMTIINIIAFLFW